MSRIPEAEIERLKREVSLPQLVETSGVKLRRQGQELVGLCAFHEEKEPSLRISEEKGVFHCFGCGVKGTVIDWTMKTEGVSFRHAVELLRRDFQPNGRPPGRELQRTEKPKLPAVVEASAENAEALDQVVDYYHETFLEEPAPQEYVRGRGLEHPELVSTEEAARGGTGGAVLDALPENGSMSRSAAEAIEARVATCEPASPPSLVASSTVGSPPNVPSSALMELLLSFVPEEKRVVYSARTQQSLFYMGEIDLEHKVLAISEEEGAERASYALKLLQSEGQLSIASPGKDPTTGRLKTQEYRVKGPVMLLMTTPAIDLAEELENRCLRLTVDESREQALGARRRAGRASAMRGRSFGLSRRW